MDGGGARLDEPVRSMLTGMDEGQDHARAAGGEPLATLDAFLAGIGGRAFRFAEAGLRQRDDALDAVQDAMLKMLAYRERPPQEWPPLFWSILRRTVTDQLASNKWWISTRNIPPRQMLRNNMNANR